MLGVADNLCTPIFNRIHRPERILRPEDDAGDAGDRLEAVLAQIENLRICSSSAHQELQFETAHGLWASSSRSFWPGVT